MKNFLIRTIRAQSVCTPASATDPRTQDAGKSAAAPSPLEQVRALDTQTCWPTHRIRSFLTTQSRGVR